jgi:isochorismate pyruvate lyase
MVVRMKPEECRTREDIRREIDRVDRALIELLFERFGYIRRMAELKADPAEARIDARVSDVLAKVTELARDRGLDVELTRALWTTLMDWNIEWERRAIAARIAKPAGASKRLPGKSKH